MNIIFFIGQLGHGGAENVVATLTKELAKRGHRITLVSHLKNQFYEISSSVNLIDVRTWQYDTYVGSFPKRVYKKAANRFRDFRSIHRILNEEKPDVVISFLQAWLWQLICLCTRRYPLICAERNAMIRPVHNNYLIKQIFYRIAFAVQVMSRYDKAWLRGRYKRVYPMPNPLRFEPITKKKYDELFPARRNILACGRVHPQKRFESLIVAFSRIANDFPDWMVDICGSIDDNTYYRRLCNLIESHGLTDRVNFIGLHSDVDLVMQSHSIFCLSSENEGFPNVLSESMANGLACVSFDIVTGPSEIIIDGLDGVIVEDNNVVSLSEALATMMRDRDFRYKIGLKATENIKRFNRDNVVDKWENMFYNTIRDFKNE